jgi:hypothetical protein
MADEDNADEQLFDELNRLQTTGQPVRPEMIAGPLAAFNARHDSTVTASDLQTHTLHLDWTCAGCGNTEPGWQMPTPSHPRLFMKDWDKPDRQFGIRICNICGQGSPIIYRGFAPVPANS